MRAINATTREGKGDTSVSFATRDISYELKAAESHAREIP